MDSNFAALADVVNPENEWRLETPKPQGWGQSVYPDSDKKYFMISVDAHLMPPRDMFKKRMDKKWHEMLPRMEVRDGVRYIVTEGTRAYPLVDFELSGEDEYRMATGGTLPDPEKQTGEDISVRVADQRKDGIDGEVIFPNGPALVMWASTNHEFVNAQCQAWNDWAYEACKPHWDFCNPAAALSTANVELAVKEVERVAKMGYRCLTLPSKPVFGPPNVSDPNYNLKMYDPLWAAIQEADLAITYHVSTGTDPRGARSTGGAVINYVCHSLAPTIEPIVNMCAAGVFQRFPKLRAGTIEANAGWVPWMLASMDEAYRKHHMWVAPKMDGLPSDYFRQNCFASFGEDEAATYMAEHFGLQDNLVWANDYPHHEGSWPHSAQAIERTFAPNMTEETRRKVLGLNAARIFKFDVPAQYKG
jgi:predicted TIM-barrel fold metal-dependent hydrolase